MIDYNKQLAISGTSGFLGSKVEEITRQEYELFALKRDQKLLSEAIFESVLLCHGAVASGKDALSELALFHGNIAFTENVIEQINAKRFVFASTASIAGFQAQVIDESSCMYPPNNYAISKLWAEELVRRKPSHAIVRFSSIYGEGMRENTIIPNYVNQALGKGEIEVWGTGSRKQNYIHVSDAAQLMLDAAISSENGIYLGVDVHEYTNLELAEIIASKTCATIKFVNSDSSLSASYDNTKTRAMLNWKPAISFEAGIGQYIEWKKRQLS